MTRRWSIACFVGALVLIAGACVPPPDGGGGSTTTSTTVNTGPPTAVAGASPTVGDAPLTVTFSSAGSSPGTGTGLTYEWDFGDGSPAATGPSVTHTYESVGTFTARLTMTSSEGSSTSPGVLITVNQDPHPKFYVRTDGSTGSTCGPRANPCASIAEARTGRRAAWR